MGKCIGIVGSRKRDSEEDYKAVFKAFKKIYNRMEEDSLVSGGCQKGGDRFAEVISKTIGVPITIHRFNWEKHGKKAGFISNTLVAKNCDILIACVSEDRMGWPEDTIKKAEKQGKQIIIV